MTATTLAGGMGQRVLRRWDLSRESTSKRTLQVYVYIYLQILELLLQRYPRALATPNLRET